MEGCRKPAWRGDVQTLTKDSRLEAYPLEAFAGGEHVWALSALLACVAQTLRGAIRAAEKTGDAVTVDVFNEVARGLDALLWKVEAHVALEPRWGPAARDGG